MILNVDVSHTAAFVSQYSDMCDLVKRELVDFLLIDLNSF